MVRKNQFCLYFCKIGLKKLASQLSSCPIFRHRENQMFKQEYEISSPPPSLFFSVDDMSNGEIEGEFSLENLNEILDNNDIDDHETFEKEEIIDHLENTELVSCIVVDFVKGKI